MPARSAGAASNGTDPNATTKDETMNDTRTQDVMAQAARRTRPDPAASTTRYTVLPSPIGELLVIDEGRGLSGLLLPGPDGRAVRPGDGWRHDSDHFDEVGRQLDAYFAGRLRTFTVPLDVRGTEFQRRVWQGLRDIPYGETVSYGQLARQVGQPGAARAVGLANNRNRIPIIIPCHRVIGADGSLTGYGGGLDRKRQLLTLEAGVLVGSGERLA